MSCWRFRRPVDLFLVFPLRHGRHDTARPGHFPWIVNLGRSIINMEFAVVKFVKATPDVMAVFPSISFNKPYCTVNARNIKREIAGSAPFAPKHYKDFVKSEKYRYFTSPILKPVKCYIISLGGKHHSYFYARSFACSLLIVYVKFTVAIYVLLLATREEAQANLPTTRFRFPLLPPDEDIYGPNTSEEERSQRTSHKV